MDHYVSYSLSSKKGSCKYWIIYGSTIGFIMGDTRRLDHGSCRV